MADAGGAAKVVESALDAAIALHRTVRDRDLSAVVRAAETIRVAFAAGGKVLTFGNGGSAADAQHLAAELVGRFERTRAAFAAVALTTDTSVLTSVANDDGFAHVFARQIEGLGHPGDVAVAISTSGESANVLEGLRVATLRGMRTVALTGRSGGPVGAAAEIHINVPDDSAARVQEVHRTLIHAICRIVEGQE
ncbi:MAG: SIS domain-containing protein [Vicinamibacterales bacterium]